MSDEPNQPGRSRGRAKGRARPPAAQTRPGDEPRPAAAAAAAHPPPMGSGGRQTHRGVSRADPAARPGDKTADVTQQMGALALEPRTQAQFGRGSSRVAMEELITKPDTKDWSKMGSSGSAISLVTNYFMLESRPTWCVYQYHVEFAPTVESSGMRRAMLGNHREVLGACYLFDGMSDLKSVVRLEQPVTELYSKRNTDDVNIRITVKRTNELHYNDPQLGHLFNTQMRRNLRHLKFLLIGRHYFDKDAVINKAQLNLQIWQGVITSIRTQEERLMMMVDPCHKVIRKDTAWDVMSDMVRRHSQNYKDIAIKELVGSIVMTMYNNRTYRIEEICWDEKPTDSFESKDGPITYLQYYSKQYDKTINDHRQPLLLCTSKEREIRGGQEARKKIMLIPELCMMTGLDERMRSNFHLMRELANETKLDPQQRATNLQAFIRRVNNNEDVKREMAAWDLKFSDRLVDFTSRVLPAETIVQRSHRSNYDPKTADFSKEMRGKEMHVAKELRSWMVICTRSDQSKCMDLMQNFQRVCPPMGMNMIPPQVFYIQDDRINTYTQTLRENMKHETQIVIFIVPNNKKDRYDALKKLTCLDFPVPSQVIVSRTLSKKPMLMSVATKIAIQLNCKLGGEPWALDIPLKTPTMIIGYDTYHDSSRRGRSAGGFVASMNGLFSQWHSRVNFHQAGGWQEISNYLYINLTEALKRYRRINGCTPQLVIFFRDGVGDGQIRYVLEHEVRQMEKCFYEVLEGKKCSNGEVPKTTTRFAFFVVNKKIGTRFFAKSQNRLINPPPGTVVDHTVTRYERYDFFLTSQSVRQGTVAPTMYNIIKDQSGLKPDHMQRLAYKLTHLYYNWPGTVRVPAPCQYAHKLAFLAGQSLHREPDEKLSDKLFYL